MARGRKPTPTHLKVVKGTDRADRRNDAEPAPDKGWPEPPHYLSERAADAWPKVCRTLDDMGVLTKADGFAVMLLCEAFADWLDARAAVEMEGSTYSTEGTNGQLMIRAHPAVAIRNDAWRRVQSAAAACGLDPSSRSKVKAQGDNGEKDDPAAKYFG